MKIRNNKTNIEITSPHICKGSYNGKDVFLDENFEELFYAKDGWEEVKEEPNDGWNDICDETTDLPSDDREVLCCIEDTDHYRYYKVCCFYEDEGGFHLGWDNDGIVIAWREIPTFNKIDYDKRRIEQNPF